MNPAEVPIDVARGAGPWPLCADVPFGKCRGNEDGHCDNGYAVDADDFLRCNE